MKRYPETIDNAWDVLYREYPEVYDAFASFPYRPGLLEMLRERFDLTGKTILDLGAGGGQSALPLARTAAQVIGVEPEAAMRALGAERAREQGVENVTLLAGTADAIPLPDATVDVVLAITAPLVETEALRVVRRPGLLLQVDVAPGCYGGELASIIGHPTPELEATSRQLVEAQGFTAVDVVTLQEYGSQEAILRTYGFIFGPRALAHLRQTGQTTIRWTFRIHYRAV
jgi:SAM-dependent methyltransferase